MQFSVNDLLNYYRCPRLLFLNKHGDKALQSPPSDFLKRLWKIGRGYESTVTDFFEYERPKYKVGDYDTGLEETVKLMQKGVDAIYQGVLKNDDLVGIPDFLIKAKGYSSLGNYYYYAVDVKGASNTREKYLFQLACYSYLIGEIQEFTPLYGGLLLLDFDLQIKYLFPLMKKVMDSIVQANKIINNTEVIPDLFIDSNCSMCQWYSFCLPEATKNKDLSIIPGVRKESKKELLKISINNYEDLSKCTSEDFINIKELNGTKGKEVIIQSKAICENKIYIKHIPDIPENKNSIFIDFESDFILNENGTDFNKIDYLIGILKANGEDEYYNGYLLEDENIVLNTFANFLQTHNDYIFYHYGHYEESIFKNKWKNLPAVNLFNVEKVVKDCLILPVTNYSLKSIAKLLGYEWKNKEASATQSMCWYSSYLETKDKKYLDLSIEYNKDDCYALKLVKDWLENLKTSGLKENSFIEIEKIK